MTRFAQALEEEIAALERELELHPSYVKLKALRATRALYAQSSDTVDLPRKLRMPDIGEFHAASVRNPPTSGKSLDAVTAVIEILRGHGAPLRTAQLMPLIADRGISFAGNAPQNILSSLLSRSPDVVSKGGHVGWALKEWESVKGGSLEGTLPFTDEHQPEAQGREAGPGGGT